MKKYSGLNYESREDCFKKCEDVKSTLIYGDLDAVPKPRLTLLIPTYKRVDMLKQALESALTQYHCDFMWNILVLDNEPYDGKPNETEKLIRKFDNKRVLYYRNSKNIRPGDNFNRGFLLARGEYVMMLHDDDFLVANTVKNMGKLLTAYSAKGLKPVGAICATYIQFEYDAEHDLIKADIAGMNSYLCNQPLNYSVYCLTHSNVKVTGHIGGAVPSNGSTFNRKAVIDAGGFNEDFGISGDLILLYNLERDYAVYQTRTPLGFYRWGANSMIKPESTRRVIKDGYDFREYIYSKHSMVGRLFKKCQYQRFTKDVVNEKNNVSRLKVSVSDFDDIYNQKPGKLWYCFFMFVNLIYSRHKNHETKKLAHIAEKRMEKIQ